MPNNIKGAFAGYKNLSGWKKYTATFVLGALFSLTMPPLGMFFLLPAILPFIVLTQLSENKKSAFLTGWVFGAGYFIAGLHWITFALTVDWDSWWWVSPLSLIVGPGLLGLFYGFPPLLAWRYRANRTAYTLIFIASWAFIEWVRGHIFTGFPWNLAGYAWFINGQIMQANAYIGIYGVTLLTLLWTSFILLEEKRTQYVIVASLLIAFIGGELRLQSTPTQFYDEGYNIRIVQPNIHQKMKWDDAERERNLQIHLQLSALANEKPIHAVVWPETATVLNRQKPSQKFLRAISNHLPNESAAIIGSLGIDYSLDTTQFFNGITFVDNAGTILTHYNKHHLVPFGEYIPYRKYLNMTPLAAGISIIGDFTPGKGIQTINLPNLPNPSPQVCYEGIFPGQVAQDDENRPAWLVNVTNDAWYGKSFGPYQHLEITRVRAVEEGLPLARAANTGISVMIDPLGRYIGKKGLEERGVLDVALPKALPPTVYSQFGDTLFFLMLIVLVIVGETTNRKEN